MSISRQVLLAFSAFVQASYKKIYIYMHAIYVQKSNRGYLGNLKCLMGYLVNLEGEKMDQSNQCSSSSTKVERKVVEKNRRNQMKHLYSILNSLLPNQSYLEALPLPDQIDEAVKYIKSLESKIQESKEKKENLMGNKKRPLCTSSYSDRSNIGSSSKAPQIEIHEMGSTLEIVLTSGLENQFIFYEVIRILHEEAAEVVSANFSVVGDMIFHVIHVEIGDARFSTFGAAKITERLRQFVNGSASEGELDLQFPELWDLDFHPGSWQF